MTDSYETSRDLYERGRRHYDQHQYESAASFFKQSFNEHPHFKSAELLGECLLKLGQHAESIFPLGAACSMNRGPRAHVLLATAFSELGMLEEAQEHINIALSRQPGHGPAKALKDTLFSDGATH